MFKIKNVPQGHWQENAQVCQLYQSHSLQPQPFPIFTENINGIAIVINK